MLKEKVRVAMLDDSSNILEIVENILHNHDQLELVLKSNDKNVFCTNLQSVNPQIIILDASIDEQHDGLKLIPTIRSLTSAKIIILTGDVASEVLLTSDVANCMSKIHINILPHVILVTHRTKTSFEMLSEEHHIQMEIKKLSEAEKQIFKLIIHGQNTKQMMQSTRKSENTIKSQIKSIHTKLRIKTSQELLKKFEHYKGEIF